MVVRVVAVVQPLPHIALLDQPPCLHIALAATYDEYFHASYKVKRIGLDVPNCRLRLVFVDAVSTVVFAVFAFLTPPSCVVLSVFPLR